MKLIYGLLIGGGLGALIGFLFLPDFTALTGIAGAALGFKFGSSGRRSRRGGNWNNDPRYDGDGSNDDNDDGGGGDDGDD